MAENPIRFIHAFLNYVDECGIYDEYDPKENTMKTSEGVMDLIEYAQSFLPERIENEEAAKRMRNLTEAERDALIGDDPEIVVDMRSEFREKMIENQGTAGLVRQLAAASNRGDMIEVKRLMELAKEYSNEV